MNKKLALILALAAFIAPNLVASNSNAKPPQSFATQGTMDQRPDASSSRKRTITQAAMASADKDAQRLKLAEESKAKEIADSLASLTLNDEHEVFSKPALSVTPGPSHAINCYQNDIRHSKFFQQPFANMIFEYLTFNDLNQARCVRTFTPLALNALMPTGERWITWVNEIRNKNGSVGDKCRKIVAACARHPNAPAKLKEIVASYYSDLPLALRFWLDPDDADELGVYDDKLKTRVSLAKDNLRKQLGELLHKRTVIEKQQAAAKARQKEPAPIEYSQYSEQLLQIDNECNAILAELQPSLDVLTPYAIADRICGQLSEFQELPEDLPILYTKNESLDACLNRVAVERLAKQFGSDNLEVLDFFAARVVAAVHACLAVQPGDHDCQLEKASMEHNLTEPFGFVSLSNAFARRPPYDLDRINIEVLDLTLIQQRIAQLRQAIAGFILQDRVVTRKKLEMACYDLETKHLDFILGRLNDIDNALMKPDLQQSDKDVLLARGRHFVDHAVRGARTTELADCRKIASAASRWYQYADEKFTKLHLARIAAFFAERVTTIAGVNDASEVDLRIVRDALAHLADCEDPYTNLTKADGFASVLGRHGHVMDINWSVRIKTWLAALLFQMGKSEAASKHLEAAMACLNNGARWLGPCGKAFLGVPLKPAFLTKIVTQLRNGKARIAEIIDRYQLPAATVVEVAYDELIAAVEKRIEEAAPADQQEEEKKTNQKKDTDA